MLKTSGYDESLSLQTRSRCLIALIYGKQTKKICYLRLVCLISKETHIIAGHHGTDLVNALKSFFIKAFYLAPPVTA
jgi:hypothetical protein